MELLYEGSLTFLSDFEAPAPVHPVVYSPFRFEGSMIGLFTSVAQRQEANTLTVPPM